MLTNNEIEKILKDAKLTETQISEYWKEKTAKELEEKQYKKYYSEHFEEIIVSKIDSKEDLTKNELSEIRDFSIKEVNGGYTMRSMSVSSILEMCDRYFMLDWKEGLTEYQENEFDNQPYEVIKKTHEETITITEWEKI